MSLVFLSKSGNVPNSDGQIHRRRNNEVLGGVELRGHDVVVVTGQDSNAGSRLPIPNSDGLIIGT